jgi:hypothetical protein
MTYGQQRALAIAVAAALGMIGAVQLGNAQTLGITAQMTAWLGVVSAGLGILAGFLPTIQGRSRDPEFLADRIDDLSASDRALLLSEMEHRHPSARASLDDERAAEGRI